MACITITIVAVSRTMPAIERRTLLCASAFAALLPMAIAQAPRVQKIGYMSFGPVSRNTIAGSHEAFLAGLNEQGLRPGQNVQIEYRHAGGRAENLPQTARELLALEVDVILAVGAKDVDALLQLTHAVPVVTVYAADHVGLGYAETLARPGRNVTGLTVQAGEMTAKWLEILKELRPGIRAVGALWDTGMGPATLMDSAAWRPDQAFRVNALQRHTMSVREARDLEPAFDAARQAGVGAVMLGPSSGVLRSELAEVARLAIKHRMPTVADLPVYAEGGLLLAYGADVPDLFRRSAALIAKILRGEKAANIPVEQPTKFVMVANLRTARAIELQLPRSLLSRADRLIE
jgi:putative ABC transport system substrate-binding protein